jgi:Na+/proline symporter
VRTKTTLTAYILLAALLLILGIQMPAFALVTLAWVGAAATWAAVQPVLWAFVFGVLAHRIGRWRP